TSVRLAAYLQDEWAINPQWSAHAGLRWEGITTRGQADDGSRPTNQSSVATPLLHAVWKPDPKTRDQVRMSLTRSYRAPALGTLIARRSVSSRYPASGTNEPLSPDRIGNAGLKPELATGIDLAYERYLPAGGVLSANLFHRRITDLMRSVTTLQTVAWSPVPRWVAQTRNIGDATTQGLELEAKFQLSQWVSGAPAVEMRSNLSLFRSRVDSVTGPDNRLDQQAKATANLGADYRVAGTPLKLGGNLNWVPGYRTQLSDEQVLTVSGKRVFDAYGVWTFNPAAALRLTASNLAPAEYTSRNAIDAPTLAGLVRETATTTSQSNVNWQLRLELKL
ncbi:MAG: TonB-dependent receptor, partial [Rubrivivax sp.]|nr:TonB-dependent receptor [Rubrivivax sp.]